MPSKQVSREVALYLQARLRQLLDQGVSPAEVVKGAGISKAQVSALKNHADKGGVGWKTLTGMAELLNMSIDQITEAAKAYRHLVVPILTVSDSAPKSDDPSPGRARAASAAAILGLSARAIASVQSWPVRKDEPDPSAWEWLNDMHAEDRRLRRTPGGGGPTPSEPSAPVTHTRRVRH